MIGGRGFAPERWSVMVSVKLIIALQRLRYHGCVGLAVREIDDLVERMAQNFPYSLWTLGI
jgi:hypothetical protein